MDIVTLIAGQLLPWLAGSAWVAWLLRDDQPGRQARVLGYGFVVGSFALTLWMRALSAAGVPFGWAAIALPLLAAAAIPVWLSRRRPAPAGPRCAAAGDDTPLVRGLWWLLAALAAAHLALALLEIVWRPLYPWDAWTQWATKARVWYALGHLAPFAYPTEWQGAATYTDAVPGYPANVPLLQVWACIGLGRWDDSLMNLPWFSFALALALGFYGQLRGAGRPPLFAMAGAYAVLSLPLLDTHVALAGYADFPLAVYYGLAAIALWRWSQTRARGQLVLAVLLAAACPLTKNPGWMWLATLAPAVIVTLLPRHGLRVVAGLAALGVVAIVGLSRSEVEIMSYQLHSTFQPVWGALWQNYFEFANWHLLWYALPVLLALNARRLLRPPLLAGSVMVAAGLGFLFVVFSFSNASAWVNDYSTVNRATLHLAPLLMFYAFALLHPLLAAAGAGDGAGAAAREAAPDTTGDPAAAAPAPH